MIGAVRIVNVALSRLGAQMISSFTEDTKAARNAEVLFDYHRDILLGQMPWSFASKSAPLSVNANVTHPVYTYAYATPSDMLQIRKLFVVDSSAYTSGRYPWEMYEKCICTDLEDASGWSVDRRAPLCGIDLTGYYPYCPGTWAHRWAVLADVRWIHVGMKLGEDGSAEAPLEGVELAVGAVWKF